MENFDLAANLYDDHFTYSQVGRAQRKQVWGNIDELNIVAPRSVLEINCGTGEDAKIWHSKKHKIIPTDLSPEMIKVASRKSPDLEFKILNINKLESVQNEFDIIFSNFGGLNCLSPTDLNAFFSKAYSKLPTNGQLILVLMGKKCIWDNLFLFLKGKWNQIGRRNTADGIEINVDGQHVTTWYYSPKQIINMASNFSCNRLKPIGLHVPPSYLANFFENKKLLLSTAIFLDKIWSFSFLSNYSDHYFISLTKN